MIESSQHYQWRQNTLMLHCQVQPKAARDEFAGLHNGRLKIRITAPPTGGKANRHLLAFLGKAFATPKSRLSIVRGETSRLKTVAVVAPVELPDACEIAPK